MPANFDLERLRDLDILDVARRLGIHLHGVTSASGQQAYCFMHEDNHPSLHFWTKTNTWKCFVCDKGGDVISLVMEYKGCDFKEACQWLASAYNIYMPGLSLYEAQRPSQNIDKQQTSKETHKKAAKVLDTEMLQWIVDRARLSDLAQQFLFEERKYKPEVVRQLRIGSITDAKRLVSLLIETFGKERCLQSGIVKEGKYGKYLFYQTPCLLFPFFDIDGHLLNLQSRYLGDKEGVQRFLFLPGETTAIFNQPVLKDMKRHETLYIAEGVTDCIGLLSAGHKAVAIPGAAAFKAKDADLLKGYSLYMFPDRDPAGQHLFETLNQYMKVRKLELPDSVKDYSDYLAGL